MCLEAIEVLYHFSKSFWCQPSSYQLHTSIKLWVVYNGTQYLTIAIFFREKASTLSSYTPRPHKSVTSFMHDHLQSSRQSEMQRNKSYLLKIVV